MTPFPHVQAAVKAEKKDDELTAAEPATQETVVNDGAPAEVLTAISTRVGHRDFSARLLRET